MWVCGAVIKTTDYFKNREINHNFNKWKQLD